MKIVKDKKVLSVPLKETPLNTQEVNDISDILKTELERHNGFGLSANQIGLKTRACIIKVREDEEPLVLINPRIVEASKEVVIYQEQCLSIDKSMRKSVKTVRNKTVTVNCDNLGTIEFSPDKEDWPEAKDYWGDRGLLECVCVQHEIDHLNGILITDKIRRYSETITASKKYGRNERVMVKLPNGTTEFMKYKKAIPLLNVGCEIL
jgi:peptide deformylase